MIIRYLVLVMMHYALLFGADQHVLSSSGLLDSEDAKDSKNKQREYVFADFKYYSAGSDLYYQDEKLEEQVFSVEYYYQTYKALYLKAGIGTTRYTYIHQKIDKQKSVKFDYVQAGAALMTYERGILNITLDLDYMVPFRTSEAEEVVNGVSSAIKKPDSKIIPSANLNLCGDYLCGGIGVTTSRYEIDDDFLITFRFGVKW